MLLSAIDVGSNTIRVLIGEFINNELSCKYSGRANTRLAEGLRETGMLIKANMEKSIAALKDFSCTIRNHNVSHIKAVGTSAIREAKNRNQFISDVLRETGICIEPISGLREAELTIKGVSLGFKGNVPLSLVVDIGGGSTEWIICNPDNTQELLGFETIQAGIINLHEAFIRNDPPSYGEILNLNDKIDALFQPLKKKIADNAGLKPVIIGTGGTITTIAAIDIGLAEYNREKVHMHTIPIERLYRLKDMLLSLPLKKRQCIKGLEPERADLIIPGVLLTIRIMELAGVNVITVSDYGLLEGVLKEIKDEQGF